MLAHRRSNEQPKQFFEVFVLIKLDIVLLILVMLFILSLKKSGCDVHLTREKRTCFRIFYLLPENIWHAF